MTKTVVTPTDDGAVITITGSTLTNRFTIKVVDQGIHIMGGWSTAKTTITEADLGVFPISRHKVCIETI